MKRINTTEVPGMQCCDLGLGIFVTEYPTENGSRFRIEISNNPISRLRAIELNGKNCDPPAALIEFMESIIKSWTEELNTSPWQAKKN